MAQRICRAQVEENRALSHDTKETVFRMIDPPTLDFVAGQYISIEVTEIKEGQPRQNNRPYSLASPPEEKETFALCVNLVEGPGSRYIHSLVPGDVMPFLYPMGFFTVKEGESDLLFIATGTGIAPIKSMIQHLCATETRRRMTLYWGVRSERDIYYETLFSGLAAHRQNFRFIRTLSRPSDEWAGLRGRVTHLLPTEISSVENLDTYLCGGWEMIREVRQILLDKGMPKKAIHYEKFY